MKLRSNQVEPVQVGIDFFKEKKTKPSIIVAPTAFGKSWVIAKIAESIEDKVLVLQPSKELLAQNYEKYITLGGFAEIYSASFGSKNIGDVTYATIGSIKSIGKTFRMLGFTKLIIDEAHLYPRSSDSMLGGFLKDSGITHVLGLTATPLKLQTNTDMSGNSFSKLAMLTSRSKYGQFFKQIIYVAQIKEMVKEKYWSPLIYDMIFLDSSSLRYNTTRSDYTEKSLIETNKNNNIGDKIIDKINELKDRKSILVFVASVAEARTLSFQTPNAKAVYAEMSKSERSAVINGFKKGEIRVVYNVNVLSVGFDHPEVDCIIMARPTASLAWYYQVLGRGTRISPTKKDCLIVDYSSNVLRFGKIEELYFKKENIWKMYGEGGKLLTGIPVHEIGMHTQSTESNTKKRDKNSKQGFGENYIIEFGKFKGRKLIDIPSTYRSWMLESFDWSRASNKDLKDSLELISD